MGCTMEKAPIAQPIIMWGFCKFFEAGYIRSGKYTGLQLICRKKMVGRGRLERPTT